MNATRRDQEAEQRWRAAAAGPRTTGSRRARSAASSRACTSSRRRSGRRACRGPPPACTPPTRSSRAGTGCARASTAGRPAPAVEQAEVARVVLKVDLGELVEQPVEPPRRGQLELRFAGALLADRVDDVAAGAPALEHRRRSARAGPGDRRRASRRRRRGRGRVPPSAPSDARSCATGTRPDAGVVGGQALELRRRAVGGAVVDEHELERRVPQAPRSTRARRTRRSSPPRCRRVRRR